MIVYLASYPRSGNSWLQLLIYTQFRRLVSSVYDIGPYPPLHIRDWQITPQPIPPEGYSQVSELLWDQAIALYQDPESSDKNRRHRMLLPGCLDFLTPENRQKLAAEDEVLIIKTHELPYQKYFPGEIVIQPLRNPGAVIWSYYRLINATRESGEMGTFLNLVILGKVKYGSWSEYHRQWLQARENLQSNYLPVYFEWLQAHQTEFCHKIAQLTGLKYLDREIPAFNKVQQQNPIAKREGKAYGWEKNYTRRELALIYDTHGEMMEKLGYAEPNYQLANKEREKMDEQLALKLRVLHDLLYEAMHFPNCATAYTNFVRSLRERLHPIGVKDIQTATLASGLKLQVDLGDRLGADIYYGYYQEYFDSQLLLSLIPPGATVVDIGANSGYYAVLAASQAGNQGRVIAFEPHPDAYELLQQNTQINNLESILECHQVCIGSLDGETDFYLTEESSFSGISATGRAKVRQQVKLPIYRLDSFLAKLSISQVDVIKIDVEGYEFAVLAGALETLKASPNCLLMLEVSAKNLNPQRQTALIEALTAIYDLGFRAWLIESQSEILQPLKSPHQIQQIGAANLFVASETSPTREKLQENHQKLRHQAFRGIAQELHLSPDELIPRNAQDPLGYKQLHGALIDLFLRQKQGELEIQKQQVKAQEMEIVKLKAEITRLEAENQARLAEIHKRDAQLQAELNLSLQERIWQKISQKVIKTGLTPGKSTKEE